MSFIDVSLAISVWTLVVSLLVAIGIIATWPRSGVLIAILWRGAASKITRKRN